MFYQELNYDDTWAENMYVQVQMTYRRVVWDNAAKLHMFLQIFDEDDNEIFYYLTSSTTVADTKTHGFRFRFDTSSIVGQNVGKVRVGVYITAMTGENVIEVNHLLATITESSSYLPFYSWTNYASKDLISQINISPSGVKIQGSKVDIYGLTTFHNGDGTGGTTIDGATITAGDMYWYKDTSNEATLNGAQITLGGNTYSGVKLEASALLFKSANVIHNAIEGGLIQTNLTADSFSAVCSTHAIATALVRVGDNTALIGADDTSTGAKCRVTTNKTDSKLEYSNGSTSNAVTANANGLYLTGTVYSEGRRVLGCASGLATCQSGTADGHTVLNFFLNGTYVGHSVY